MDEQQQRNSKPAPVDITAEVEIQKSGHVNIWWFPHNFCQSKLGSNSAGSNACTLIVVLVAQRCHHNPAIIQDTVNHDLLLALGESILTGNELHQHLIQHRRAQLQLTVPEAIEAAGKIIQNIHEWKSLIFLLDLKESMHEQLEEQVKEWYQTSDSQHHSDLFVILIAGSRSILLIFQQHEDRVTLVDTHQHLNKGAVIAQTTFRNLSSLCTWYCFIMRTCYGIRPQCYELSFLCFEKAG